MTMKKFFAAVLMLAILAGSWAWAWDGGEITMSGWAREGVAAAYESGAVSEAFDLGTDYTKPITRAQLARMAVDLVLWQQDTTLSALAEKLGIELEDTALAVPAAYQTEENTSDEAFLPTPEPVPEVESDETEAGEPSEESMPDTPPEAEDAPSAPVEETEAPAAPEENEPEQEPPHGDPLDGGLPYVVSGSFRDTRSVYVEAAARLGIVKGSDGLYRPDDMISRAEAAAIVQRCMTVLGKPNANRAPMQFADYYDIPRWAVTAVKYASGRTDAAGQAIMGGTGSGFSPHGTYTIEQSILAIGRMQSSLQVEEVEENWQSGTGYDSVTLKLTFGGDCTLGRGHNFPYAGSFDEMYDQQGPAYFFSNISEFFDDDLTMVNFEGTLTTATAHANKTFVFKGRPEYVNILKEGSIDVVTVANNHSMDYLKRGFDDTVNYLSPHVEVSGYERMPIVTVKGVRIGFASNLGWAFDQSQKDFIENAVRSLRERGADLVVFNYHWGIERSYRSNATQKAIGRYCIDQGADLVIGHHPHVVQEVETYKGKQIVYSLGNLVFGGNHNPSDKNCLIFRQSFTIDLDSREVTGSSCEALPYRVSSVNNRNDYRPTRK